MYGFDSAAEDDKAVLASKSWLQRQLHALMQHMESLRSVTMLMQLMHEENYTCVQLQQLSLSLKCQVSVPAHGAFDLALITG